MLTKYYVVSAGSIFGRVQGMSLDGSLWPPTLIARLSINFPFVNIHAHEPDRGNEICNAPSLQYASAKDYAQNGPEAC